MDNSSKNGEEPLDETIHTDNSDCKEPLLGIQKYGKC